MEKNTKNLSKEEIQKMKSPHWREYPFELQKKKSNRGTSKEDTDRKRVKKALEIINEARELGDDLMETWDE